MSDRVVMVTLGKPNSRNLLYATATAEVSSHITSLSSWKSDGTLLCLVIVTSNAGTIFFSDGFHMGLCNLRVKSSMVGAHNGYLYIRFHRIFSYMISSMHRNLQPVRRTI